MQKIIYKEVLDKKTYLEMTITYNSGSGTNIGVKAYPTKNISEEVRTEKGRADLYVDGKKKTKLLNIWVNKRFRHQGIGGRIVNILVDYVRDGAAFEVTGDITSAEDLEKATEFYKKHGFSISEEMLEYGKHTLIYQALIAPKFGEFYNLHDVTRVIPKNKRLGK